MEGRVIDQFGLSRVALIRNPILIVIVGLYGLVQLPQLALQPTQPIVAAIISLGITGLMLIVMPFFQGDLLGMADEALNGQTGLGTLVSEGKTNYIRLLLGYLALFAVNLVLAVAAIVYVVVLAILGAFYATYSVTFYRSIEQTTHST